MFFLFHWVYTCVRAFVRVDVEPTGQFHHKLKGQKANVRHPPSLTFLSVFFFVQCLLCAVVVWREVASGDDLCFYISLNLTLHLSLSSFLLFFCGCVCVCLCSCVSECSRATQTMSSGNRSSTRRVSGTTPIQGPSSHALSSQNELLAGIEQDADAPELLRRSSQLMQQRQLFSLQQQQQQQQQLREQEDKERAEQEALQTRQHPPPQHHPARRGSVDQSAPQSSSPPRSSHPPHGGDPQSSPTFPRPHHRSSSSGGGGNSEGSPRASSGDPLVTVNEREGFHTPPNPILGSPSTAASLGWSPHVTQDTAVPCAPDSLSSLPAAFVAGQSPVRTGGAVAVLAAAPVAGGGSGAGGTMGSSPHTAFSAGEAAPTLASLALPPVESVAVRRGGGGGDPVAATASHTPTLPPPIEVEPRMSSGGGDGMPRSSCPPSPPPPAPARVSSPPPAPSVLYNVDRNLKFSQSGPQRPSSANPPQERSSIGAPHTTHPATEAPATVTASTASGLLSHPTATVQSTTVPPSSSSFSATATTTKTATVNGVQPGTVAGDVRRDDSAAEMAHETGTSAVEATVNPECPLPTSVPLNPSASSRITSAHAPSEEKSSSSRASRFTLRRLKPMTTTTTSTAANGSPRQGQLGAVFSAEAGDAARVGHDGGAGGATGDSSGTTAASSTAAAAAGASGGAPAASSAAGGLRGQLGAASSTATTAAQKAADASQQRWLKPPGTQMAQTGSPHAGVGRNVDMLAFRDTRVMRGASSSAMFRSHSMMRHPSVRSQSGLLTPSGFTDATAAAAASAFTSSPFPSPRSAAAAGSGGDGNHKARATETGASTLLGGYASRRGSGFSGLETGGKAEARPSQTAAASAPTVPGHLTADSPVFSHVQQGRRDGGRFGDGGGRGGEDYPLANPSSDDIRATVSPAAPTMPAASSSSSPLPPTSPVQRPPLSSVATVTSPPAKAGSTTATQGEAAAAAGAAVVAAGGDNLPQAELSTSSASSRRARSPSPSHVVSGAPVTTGAAVKAGSSGAALSLTSPHGLVHTTGTREATSTAAAATEASAPSPSPSTAMNTGARLQSTLTASRSAPPRSRHSAAASMAGDPVLIRTMSGRVLPQLASAASPLPPPPPPAASVQVPGSAVLGLPAPAVDNISTIEAAIKAAEYTIFLEEVEAAQQPLGIPVGLAAVKKPALFALFGMLERASRFDEFGMLYHVYRRQLTPFLRRVSENIYKCGQVDVARAHLQLMHLLEHPEDNEKVGEEFYSDPVNAWPLYMLYLTCCFYVTAVRYGYTALFDAIRLTGGLLSVGKGLFAAVAIAMSADEATLSVNTARMYIAAFYVGILMRRQQNDLEGGLKLVSHHNFAFLLVNIPIYNLRLLVEQVNHGLFFDCGGDPVTPSTESALGSATGSAAGGGGGEASPARPRGQRYVRPHSEVEVSRVISSRSAIVCGHPLDLMRLDILLTRYADFNGVKIHKDYLPASAPENSGYYNKSLLFDLLGYWDAMGVSFSPSELKMPLYSPVDGEIWDADSLLNEEKFSHVVAEATTFRNQDLTFSLQHIRDGDVLLDFSAHALGIGPLIAWTNKDITIISAPANRCELSALPPPRRSPQDSAVLSTLQKLSVINRVLQDLEVSGGTCVVPVTQALSEFHIGESSSSGGSPLMPSAFSSAHSQSHTPVELSMTFLELGLLRLTSDGKPSPLVTTTTTAGPRTAVPSLMEGSCGGGGSGATTAAPGATTTAGGGGSAQKNSGDGQGNKAGTNSSVTAVSSDGGDAVSAKPLVSDAGANTTGATGGGTVSSNGTSSTPDHHPHSPGGRSVLSIGPAISRTGSGLNGEGVANAAHPIVMGGGANTSTNASCGGGRVMWGDDGVLGELGSPSMSSYPATAIRRLNSIRVSTAAAAAAASGGGGGGGGTSLGAAGLARHPSSSALGAARSSPAPLLQPGSHHSSLHNSPFCGQPAAGIGSVPSSTTPTSERGPVDGGPPVGAAAAEPKGYHTAATADIQSILVNQPPWPQHGEEQQQQQHVLLPARKRSPTDPPLPVQAPQLAPTRTVRFERASDPATMGMWYGVTLQRDDTVVNSANMSVGDVAAASSSLPRELSTFPIAPSVPAGTTAAAASVRGENEVGRRPSAGWMGRGSSNFSFVLETHPSDLQTTIVNGSRFPSMLALQGVGGGGNGNALAAPGSRRSSGQGVVIDSCFSEDYVIQANTHFPGVINVYQVSPLIKYYEMQFGCVLSGGAVRFAKQLKLFSAMDFPPYTLLICPTVFALLELWDGLEFVERWCRCS